MIVDSLLEDLRKSLEGKLENKSYYGSVSIQANIQAGKLISGNISEKRCSLYKHKESKNDN